MDREEFFDWLDAMMLSDYNRDLHWQAAHDDGAGCITIKFYNVEEWETEQPPTNDSLY